MPRLRGDAVRLAASPQDSHDHFRCGNRGLDRRGTRARYRNRRVVKRETRAKSFPMKRTMLLLVLLLALVMESAFVGLAAKAETYPSRPGRFVIPFPAGGPGDIVVRLLSDKLQKGLHQPFIVENRPGAGGLIGTDAVAKAPADGYTILEGPDTLLSINPYLFKSVPFKPGDLVPLTYLADISLVL